MENVEVVYSPRGVRHTVGIDYDRYQCEYAVYFDGRIYCHADTYREAIQEKHALLKEKRLKRELKRAQ